MIRCDKCGDELTHYADIVEVKPWIQAASDGKLSHLCLRCDEILNMTLQAAEDKVIQRYKDKVIRNFCKDVPVTKKLGEPDQEHYIEAVQHNDPYITLPAVPSDDDEPLELGEPDKINPADIPPSVGQRDLPVYIAPPPIKRSVLDKLLLKLPGVR